MRNRRLCLAGDGWGAVAAYKSLKNTFKSFDVLTVDQDLKDDFSSDIIEISSFDQTDAEVVICAGYAPIITKNQLKQKTFINIHYSLLPAYRGIHSTVWAIINDEDNLGLTIHLMNEYIDDGPIIKQYSVKNDRSSTSAEYMIKFNGWIKENLGWVIDDYLSGKISLQIQDKRMASWVGWRNMLDCKIDFSRDHRYLKNFFRALVDPYPLPYIELQKTREEFEIQAVDFLSRNISTHIGRILNVDSEGVYISSNDGYVVLKEIYDREGNKVDYSNFRIGAFINQDLR